MALARTQSANVHERIRNALSEHDTTGLILRRSNGKFTIGIPEASHELLLDMLSGKSPQPPQGLPVLFESEIQPGALPDVPLPKEQTLVDELRYKTTRLHGRATYRIVTTYNPYVSLDHPKISTKVFLKGVNGRALHKIDHNTLGEAVKTHALILHAMNSLA